MANSVRLLLRFWRYNCKSRSASAFLASVLCAITRHATPIRIYNLPNSGKAFQADVPAKNISGSYATYEKQIDADGITLFYTKTTYAPTVLLFTSNKNTHEN